LDCARLAAAFTSRELATGGLSRAAKASEYVKLDPDGLKNLIGCRPASRPIQSGGKPRALQSADAGRTAGGWPYAAVTMKQAPLEPVREAIKQLHPMAAAIHAGLSGFALKVD